MKLHLPVQLFRIVTSVGALLPAWLYAGYTTPTTITIPAGYRAVVVDDPEDLKPYVSDAADIAFRISKSLTFDNWKYAFVSAINGARYYTSHSAASPVNITITNTAGRKFLTYESFTMNALGDVLFKDNNGAQCQGVIHGNDNTAITFNGNKSVRFINSKNGALSASNNSTISVCDNGNLEFSRNYTASVSTGGAIVVQCKSAILVNNNGDIKFCDNTDSDSYGGALSCSGNSRIEVNGNGHVTFSGNKVYTHCTVTYGGAIGAVSESVITLNNNKSVSFRNNVVPDDAENTSACGGAIGVGDNCRLELNGNGSVEFHGSVISEPDSAGGAIFAAEKSSLTLNDNGSVVFSNNSSKSPDEMRGGGAYYGLLASLTMNRNGSVKFSGNSADNGGAVYIHENNLQVNDNDSVLFSGNKSASDFSYGGALYVCKGTVALNNNGKVDFIGNVASADTSDAQGGAIYLGGSGGVQLDGNGSVSFVGNTATGATYAAGGAIYLAYSRGASLTIRNNGAVLFEKNAEIKPDSVLLRSINIHPLLSLDLFSLSSPKGKTIEFRDAVKVSAANTRLNADYTDSIGKVHKQEGAIVLTGKYTEEHLRSVMDSHKIGRTASADEITQSRTYELGDNVSLEGGELRIEESALVEGLSFSAKAGSSSALTLKNATLDISTLSLGESTTLKVQGSSTVDGTINAAAGSNVSFVVAKENADKAVLTHKNGSLSLSGKVGIKVSASGQLTDGASYVLMTGSSQPSNWGSYADVQLPVTASDSSCLYWSGSSLMFFYDLLRAEWTNQSGNRKWDTSSVNWKDDGVNIPYKNHAAVTFNSTGAGTVNLTGTLTPYSVTVNNGSGYNYTWQGSGKLSGDMKLYKMGSGALTIKNTNTFTGGTYIYGGKVVLGADNALGSGSISISSGTLNLNGKLLSNNITASGSSVIQNGGSFRGNVTLNGTLNSGSWLSLYRDKTATLMSGYMYGKFTGVGKVVKSGSGTVVLNASNTYTGGTDIKAGTLKLGADKALGTGNVTMSGGTLDMNGKLLTNYISAKGSVKVLNGGNYGGNFVLDGTLADGSWLRVNSGKTATLKSGTVSGKFSGAGKVVKSSSGTVTFKGVNNCAGGTDITAGTLVLGTNNALGTGKVTMSGGTLNMNSKSLSNYITAKGSTNILNGGNYNGNYELSGNLGSNSWLRINSGKKATLRSGTMSGSLTGAGETIIAGKVNLNGGRIKTNKLTVNGSGRQLTANSSGLSMNKSASVITLASQGRLNSAGAITAKNIELSGSSVLNAKNSTARSIDLGGTLKATSSTVSLYGNLTAANVTLNNAVLTDEGSSTSAVKVTGTATVSNNAKFNIKGYLTGKNLTLSKGKLKQYGHNNGVALSGTLSMNSGSSLTTSGTLSAGTMTLNGGTINLTSSAFKSVTVTGTLTLNKAIDLNLGCSNLVKGKDYKLITFKKTNLTKKSNLASLLGMSGSGATLTLNSTNIAIRVTNTTAWNKYLTANKSLFNSTTTAMLPELEEEEEVVEEILTTSVSETTEAVAAFDRSGADALVQSNWGMLNASRAFTDTIGNRASNRRALGEEQKSSVWMSAMGASSRLSSDGVAAGSDYNLFGAAFGMEQQLTEKSSLGLAIGNSRGKVSSFTSGRTKQDTLHTALYGQHLLQQSTSDALTLDWSAAYGRTESRWNGIEWDQRALQLDARATYAHQLNDKTTVSAFAGLQYYASDSATVAEGCESGSIQNLRGEIGVGIGHRATSKTSVYGELSFVGDMARNNPTATVGEYRVRGANPGRAGINLSAGVNHALNEKWSVNASYNMELMERANSHSANIGASYKF